MNIKTDEKVIGGNKQTKSACVRPLFESSLPGSVDIKQQQQVETVFSVKSKQFKLDCGIVLGTLNSKVNELKIGLSYHDEHTANFEEFLASIENFLFATGMSLTQADKDRLKAHYKRFSIHKNTVE